MNRFQIVIGLLCTLSGLSIACGGSSSGPTASNGQNQEAALPGTAGECTSIQTQNEEPLLANAQYYAVVEQVTCPAGTREVYECFGTNSSMGDGWGCAVGNIAVPISGDGSLFCNATDYPTTYAPVFSQDQQWPEYSDASCSAYPGSILCTDPTIGNLRCETTQQFQPE